jgi:hypothetical protein
METGVSGVHARDAINAGAAENPKSLDDPAQRGKKWPTAHHNFWPGQIQVQKGANILLNRDASDT